MPLNRDAKEQLARFQPLPYTFQKGVLSNVPRTDGPADGQAQPLIQRCKDAAVDKRTEKKTRDERMNRQKDRQTEGKTKKDRASGLSRGKGEAIGAEGKYVVSSRKENEE